MGRLVVLIEVGADEVQISERVLLVYDGLVLQHLTANVISLHHIVHLGELLGALLGHSIHRALLVATVIAALGRNGIAVSYRRCLLHVVDLGAGLLLANVMHRQVELVSLDHLLRIMLAR